MDTATDKASTEAGGRLPAEIVWDPPGGCESISRPGKSRDYDGTRYHLYGGLEQLDFFERLGRRTHVYMRGDEPVPGVTTALNVLSKPALIWWAVGMACDYGYGHASLLEAKPATVHIGRKDKYPRIRDAGFELKFRPDPKAAGRVIVSVPELDVTAKFKEAWYDALTAPVDIRLLLLLENGRVEHSKFKRAAANIGTVAHHWIKLYVKDAIRNGGRGRPHGESADIWPILSVEYPDFPDWDQAHNAVNGFESWAARHDILWLSSERVVYSREHGFCGTLDLEAVIDGKLTLGDLKTSNAIYPEMALQIAGYTLPREEEADYLYSRGHASLEDPLRYDRWLILRLSKEAEGDTPLFEARDLGGRDEYAANREAFLHALGLYNRMAELKAASEGGR